MDNVSVDSDVENQGVFRRWFPGWGGWYGSSSSVVSDVDKKVENLRQKDLEIGKLNPIT